jgi:hypothetical protein
MTRSRPVCWANSTGSVQISREPGIARPAEQDVDLFHRIAATGPAGHMAEYRPSIQRPELWRKL